MELIFILLFSLIVLVLFGYVLINIFRISIYNPFVALWLGVFGLGLWASIIHLFMPLSGLASILCLLPCLFGITRAYKAYKVWVLESIKSKLTQCFLFTVFFFIILACVSSIGLGNAYDTDLYHLQIVAWIRDFAIVPGLGNLHSRFVNSSIWYVIAAIFPASLAVYLPQLMSGIFYIGIFGWLFSSLYMCRKKWQFTYLLAIACCSIYFYGRTLSPSLYADPVALFLCVIAMYYFMSVFYDESTFCKDNMILGLFLIALSFSIKPLTGISIIFACIVSIIAIKKQMVTWQNILIAFSLPAVAGALWCLNNFILSGYPLFPLAISPIAVDWVMPPSFAEGISNAVQGWARWPRAGYQLALEFGITYWFPSWFEMHVSSKYFRYVLLLPLFLSCFLWTYLLIKKIDKMTFLFFAWVSLSIIFWFIVYPDPRFGREYFWILLAMGLAFFIIKHPKNKCIELIFSWQNFTILLFIVFLAWAQVKAFKKQGNLTWDAEPWPAIAVEQLEIKTEKNEPLFYVWLPIEGDKCGNTPVPCAPSLNQFLFRRNPHDLGEGFGMKP